MKRVYLFPGQGSQRVGMGKSLAERFPASRAVFEEVDDALGEHLSQTIWEGPEEALRLTKNAQPALMAVSMAVVRALEEKGHGLAEKGAFVAGHSLGEYSALAAAGALSVSEAARLLRLRGEAMQEAVPEGVGAMAALLGLEMDAVEGAVSEAARETGALCEAANDNAPGQIVISGEKKAVEKAMEIARAKGAKRALPLEVSAPFHCRLMEPAAKRMEEAFSDLRLKPLQIPLISNVLARPTEDLEDILSNLVKQITARVRWRESVLFMIEAGVGSFVELGEGRVLSAIAKRMTKGGDREAQILSLGAAEEMEKFLEEEHV